MLNIQQIRKDTPGTQKFIHFNNAGSSLPSHNVTKVMTDYLAKEAVMGGYELAQESASETDQFYTLMAQLLHCQAHNIAFTTNATDSYNKALSSILFESGDVILTTEDDYVSNQIAFLALKKRFGVVVKRASVQINGGVSVDSMKELIHKYDPKLVAVTHVPSTSGLVQPVELIGQLCKEKGILYLVDSCQAVGQMPLDVNEIACDFMTGTFRKFLRGPRGVGFLYVSDRVLEDGLEPCFVDSGGARWTNPNEYKSIASARRFELWERSHALMLGGKAAVEYALNVGLENIENRVLLLSTRLRTQLGQIPSITTHDRGEKLCGIVTFTSEKYTPTYLKSALMAQHIHCSISSKEGAWMDFSRKGIDAALRFSPHYYNSEKEVDKVISVISRL